MTAVGGVSLAEPRPPYRSGHGLGRRGEEAAARHLASRGLRILERGFRSRAGEIDIVAQDGETLVFVEVKSRSSLACGRPAEAVDSRKRRRLLNAASWYLLSRGGPERPCRFDVVEVLETPDGALRVGVVQDAFGAP